jgi:hypothetical protein
VREGDVGDGSIQDFHERGERDRNGDEPGVMGRAPQGMLGR